MSNVELTGVDWLGRGWLLILAFTAAALLVAVLRRPCRRLFGAERAFQLWLLPPLALLASQLPHAADAPSTMLPPMVFAITSAAATLPAHATAASVIDWRIFAAALWLSGMFVSLWLAAVAQSRYRARLHGASVVDGLHSPRLVLRARGTDVGPALVGAWRSRIVLPADFEQRYDAMEQALVLAHEVAHARRGDGWWCLLARILAALFWFHPLAWWALAALRHDQELACDAVVLREHGTQRRRYANAMLKTQSSAFALPVGCPWSPRHPVTERIAMLKLPSPNGRRAKRRNARRLRTRHCRGRLGLCRRHAAGTARGPESPRPGVPVGHAGRADDRQWPRTPYGSCGFRAVHGAGRGRDGKRGCREGGSNHRARR